MEIIESTIIGVRERIEGYENDIQQNDVQLQVYLKIQRELQSGLEQLKRELKEQERKKEEAESPAGREKLRIEEARRQYIELKQKERDLQVPIDSAQMQRMGLRRRPVEDGLYKIANVPSSGINKLNSQGFAFTTKFNKLMSGFSGERNALEELEKLKSEGGTKRKRSHLKTRRSYH
jgi:hypothetical protein